MGITEKGEYFNSRKKYGGKQRAEDTTVREYVRRKIREDDSQPPKKGKTYRDVYKPGDEREREVSKSYNPTPIEREMKEWEDENRRNHVPMLRFYSKDFQGEQMVKKAARKKMAKKMMMK